MKRVFVTCKVLDSNIVKNKIQRKIFILDEMIHDLKDFIKMIAQTFEDTRINTLFHKNGFKIDNINELDDNDLLYAEYVEKKHDEDEWINLNVGGRVFQTTKSTLITREPESYFTRFLSHLDECTIEHDEKGLLIIKINRSGRYFEVILDYLRHGKLILDVNLSLEGVLEEAQFYSLKNLIELIKKEIAKRQISVMKPSSKLSRYDVISFLCITKSENNLRFQSVDLQVINLFRVLIRDLKSFHMVKNWQGADLSKLDLSYINFKYANLSGCNLSNCNLSHSSFEKADLSKASLKYAICHGVTMIWTNLEYCDMSNCDFEVSFIEFL